MLNTWSWSKLLCAFKGDDNTTPNSYKRMIMMIYEIGCRSEPANEMAKTIAAYLNESNSTTKMSLIKV